jgi:hypothetical protein
MNKHINPFSPPRMALNLTLLFSIFFLAACGSGTGSSIQVMPTATYEVRDKTIGDMTTPEMEKSGTVTPNADRGFDCANVSQIPSAECAALVALYNSTNGPDWVDNSRWLASDTPCTWYGINCTSGHVTDISLGYNQLTGILPPELGNLSHLRVLGLLANRLHGPIPAELGHLSELVSLEISANQLTGSLPAELGDLPNLQTLSLASNQLSGAIPPALGHIKTLKSLVLSHNQFSGAVPAELGHMAQLYALYLSNNQLSGTIPASLGSFSQLSELDLRYNQLCGPVPEPITHLNQRILWGNQLDGTITASGQASFRVDYEGVHFTADSSLATSIWPEVIPATSDLEAQEGPSFWSAAPEHLRFTFADPHLSLERQRMGINLAAEAQIFVYPLAALADINPLVRTRIERLQNLLAERGTVPAGELPLLPLANSAQVFHAQAQYLAFGNIQGLRFISQHSQDPRPIMLNQELFYSFQGFTDDGAYYLAAFFPVTTTVLPDTITEVDLAVINDSEASYAAYLSETTAVLDQLPPAEFIPNLTLLDAVVTSLRLHPNSVSFYEVPSFNLVIQPIDLVSGAPDGMWQLNSNGE